jgi:hypothetical protein
MWWKVEPLTRVGLFGRPSSGHQQRQTAGQGKTSLRNLACGDCQSPEDKVLRGSRSYRFSHQSPLGFAREALHRVEPTDSQSDIVNRFMENARTFPKLTRGTALGRTWLAGSLCRLALLALIFGSLLPALRNRGNIRPTSGKFPGDGGIKVLEYIKFG